MSEIELFIDRLRRAFEGEAWHGPALLEILAGVDAATAAARPIPAAHTIWELVLHVAGWERVVAGRLKGQALTLGDEENFPRIRETSEASWQQAIQTLRATHEDLIKAVSALSEERLGDRVPGKDYDVRFMLAGAIEHAAYHGGQMALLKRSRR